jgi:hypothetical protein
MHRRSTVKMIDKLVDAMAGPARFDALAERLSPQRSAFRASRCEPILQNSLVLHRVEFGDLAKAHHLRFAVRLVG